MPPERRPLPELTGVQRAVADLKLMYPAITQQELADAVGISLTGARQALHTPQARVYMANYLDKAGATVEKAARVISEAMDAMETKFFSFEGRVCDERDVVDHGTRLGAAQLNLKARGELKEGAQVQVNLYADLTDQQLAAIASGAADPRSFLPEARNGG